MVLNSPVVALNAIPVEALLEVSVQIPFASAPVNSFNKLIVVASTEQSEVGVLGTPALTGLFSIIEIEVSPVHPLASETVTV